MSIRGLFIRKIKGLSYNVCNAPVQPLHYNSAQSWGHYELLGFINISVPSESPVNTCPLPERPAMDHPRDVVFGGNEPSDRLVPARLLSPTRNRLLYSGRTSVILLRQDSKLHGLR
jgi:hypothetical protein